MIRVAIADDHSILRAGLRQILEDSGDISVQAEAGDGAELLSKLRTVQCDVVVLDVSMPGRSGVDLLPRLKEEHPRLPVLILSTYPEEQYAARLIKTGAAGYLNKKSAPDMLVQAVRKVARGGRFITESVGAILAGEVSQTHQKRAGHAALSNREFEVLRLLATGYSTGDIAKRLSLSTTTVATYRARLMEKLALRNTADLVRYAIEQQLLD